MIKIIIVYFLKIIIFDKNNYENNYGFHKNNYGAHTGSISPFMIKKLGVKHIIIGHSENRESGENDKIIEEKLNSSLKNGGFDYNQEITINADIKIKELDISHSVSAKIYTPERDE